MSNVIWDDKIHKVMANPIRRKIIDSLNRENMSFSQILNSIGDFNNHGKLGYHLRTLREFIEQDSNKNYYLNDRGILLSKIMHEYRIQLSEVPDYVGYVQGLKARDHAFALYKDNEFRRRIVFPFLRQGLSNGYAVAYFCQESQLDSDVEAFRKFGVELDTLPRDALTVLSAEDWYVRRGKAEHKTLKSNLEKNVQQKVEAGFAGLVVSGEPGVLIENGFDEECVKCEESMGRQLPSDRYAICLYNYNIMKDNINNRILNSHGHIISKNLLGELL
ncbi:hypothetical protein A3K78_06205 [Candidatus Bathyarchaeota archaeon RBG_13_52_12]|nr:MAG: hypothetical protein A3K78_06205 [Candidatus Bathyarchaeota archaeon RBG_13_52_12]